MDMTFLIASGIGMIAPCVVLWAADQRARLRARH
jgi:hypothetical protein